MSTLQQKIETIEKVGAGDAADQVLQNLIRLHVQRYARQVAVVQQELAPFEQQYGISSAECHRRFTAGEMGDSVEIMEWMGLYEDVLLYQQRMNTLRAVTET